MSHQANNNSSASTEIDTNDTLSAAIEKLKIDRPELHAKCQVQGAYIMRSMPNTETLGVDTEGNEILTQKLIRTVNDYELTPEDLSSSERSVMESSYGVDWMEFVRKQK